MQRFAKNTRVPWEETRKQIERVLMQYGAGGFGYAWDRRPEPNPDAGRFGQPKTIERDIVFITFKMPGKPEAKAEADKAWRAIKMTVPMPTLVEAGGSQDRHGKAIRQRWRAMLLVIKAKLEGVACGIESLDHAFLADIVTDSGETVSQRFIPQLEAIYRGPKTPLLTAGGER